MFGASSASTAFPTAVPAPETQGRPERLGADRFAQPLVHGPHLPDRQLGVDRPDGGASGRSERGGIPPCAHHHVVIAPGVLDGRQIVGRLGLRFETGVRHISDDADNGEPGGATARKTMGLELAEQLG